MCHEKTELKVFVVVIPKEGWARMAHFRIWVFWLHRLYSLKVGVIPVSYRGMTTMKTLRSVFSRRTSFLHRMDTGLHTSRILSIWLPYEGYLSHQGHSMWQHKCKYRASSDRETLATLMNSDMRPWVPIRPFSIYSMVSDPDRGFCTLSEEKNLQVSDFFQFLFFFFSFWRKKEKKKNLKKK